MHEYDIALKSALRCLTGNVLRELTGCEVTRWENVELVDVQSRRADMLGETSDGGLLHIEMQSSNEAGMAARMLEYAAAINRQFGKIPQQLVLYVGRGKLRMKTELPGHGWSFRCRIVDIRELDGDRLIAGGQVEDNVIAVLANLRDERAAIRKILTRIARCGPLRRESALAQTGVAGRVEKACTHPGAGETKHANYRRHHGPSDHRTQNPARRAAGRPARHEAGRAARHSTGHGKRHGKGPSGRGTADPAPHDRPPFWAGIPSCAQADRCAASYRGGEACLASIRSIKP